MTRGTQEKGQSGARHRRRGDIGAAIANRYVAEGARVAVADISSAHAAVFLVSADSEYVVAQTLYVDGGNWMS